MARPETGCSATDSKCTHVSFTISCFWSETWPELVLHMEPLLSSAGPWVGTGMFTGWVWVGQGRHVSVRWTCTHAKLRNSGGFTFAVVCPGRKCTQKTELSLLDSFGKPQIAWGSLFSVYGISQEESSVPGAPTLWLGQRLGWWMKQRSGTPLILSPLPEKIWQKMESQLLKPGHYISSFASSSRHRHPHSHGGQLGHSFSAHYVHMISVASETIVWKI